MTMKKTEKSRDGRAASQRQLRVGEELRHLLAEILARDELRDPALQGTTITVTEVRISPDLKSATVFVMPLGGKDSPERIAALQRAAGFLRSLIAREVTLRSVPSLRFALDTSFDHASHIEALLHRPEVERDILSAPGHASSPGDDDGA
jgi:ribosome-binding factor A